MILYYKVVHGLASALVERNLKGPGKPFILGGDRGGEGMIIL